MLAPLNEDNLYNPYPSSIRRSGIPLPYDGPGLPLSFYAPLAKTNNHETQQRYNNLEASETKAQADFVETQNTVIPGPSLHQNTNRAPLARVEQLQIPPFNDNVHSSINGARAMTYQQEPVPLDGLVRPPTAQNARLYGHAKHGDLSGAQNSSPPRHEVMGSSQRQPNSAARNVLPQFQHAPAYSAANGLAHQQSSIPTSSNPIAGTARVKSTPMPVPGTIVPQTQPDINQPDPAQGVGISGRKPAGRQGAPRPPAYTLIEECIIIEGMRNGASDDEIADELGRHRGQAIEHKIRRMIAQGKVEDRE